MAIAEKIEQLKQARADLDKQIAEEIAEAVPAILKQVLEWVDTLNEYNKGDKYSLKRGIYSVTVENMNRPFSVSNPTEYQGPAERTAG
jgi:uncharacterized coiled-coil DUF342 family protein